MQSSKECRIWLLDTSAMGGEDHRTPVYTTPLVCNEEVQFAAAGPWGALATWEDTDGTRGRFEQTDDHRDCASESQIGWSVALSLACLRQHPM